MLPNQRLQPERTMSTFSGGNCAAAEVRSLGRMNSRTSRTIRYMILGAGLVALGVWSGDLLAATGYAGWLLGPLSWLA